MIMMEKQQWISAESKSFFQSFLRSYLAGTCFNPSGYSSVGVAFAMYPALEYIYKDPQKTKQACSRYAGYFNTHPFWVPCAMGLFISLEQAIARGGMQANALEKNIKTICHTLSAIGDSLFSGSLLVLWALSTLCFFCADYTYRALFFSLFCLFGIQLFRIITFWAGLRYGLSFLITLKNVKLINWSRPIKMINALLLVSFLALAWPDKIPRLEWFLMLVFMAGGAYILFAKKIRREYVLIGCMLALLLFLQLSHWLTEKVMIYGFFE